MSDALAESLRFHERGVHVMGEEITRVAGMDDKIGLGDGAAVGHPLAADLIVFEVGGLFHAQGLSCGGVAGEADDW